MNPITVKQQIQELTDKLLEYNKQYYRNSVSKITDYEYDKLLAKLKSLEEKYPQFKAINSPTSNVGIDNSKGFKTVKHRIPMMSLDNTYTEEGVKDFLTSVKRVCYSKNIDYVIECKIDGLSISCRYKQGHLVQALTRGNGFSGDDVTAIALLIEDVPNIITFPYTIPDVFEIRGEVYMSFTDFNKINEKRVNAGLDPLANPRNAASGTLKTLDKNIIFERPLHAVFYDIGEVSSEITISSQREMFRFFDRCCIPYVTKFCISHSDEEVLDGLSEIDVFRHTLDFPTDGAVIKIDRFDQRKIIGVTAKYPKWAKAFKFAPNQIDTKLLGITIQVGRSGVLTPVAELEPVWLDGSNIKRATLHNEDFIKKMDIRIGDTVTIEKAGEIIPAVVGNVSHLVGSQPFNFYEHVGGKCPICHEPIEKAPGEVAWKCVNPHCKAQLERTILHFAEKNALDLEGLGITVAKSIVDTGKVSTIIDLFKLASIDYVSLIVEGGKMLGTNGVKLYNSIKESVNKPLANWLYAIGIPGVGKTVSSQLSYKYKDLKDFVTNFVPNKAFVVEDNIDKFLHSTFGNFIVGSLLELGINPKGEVYGSSALAGKSIAITGTLTHMDRHNVERAIVAGGGKVSSAVSKATNYLVAGDSNGKESTKLKQAKLLGIPILTEDDLLLLLK